MPSLALLLALAAAVTALLACINARRVVKDATRELEQMRAEAEERQKAYMEAMAYLAEIERQINTPTTVTTRLKR